MQVHRMNGHSHLARTVFIQLNFAQGSSSLNQEADMVRSRVLGDARPASMLLVVPQLVRPEFLLEVEIIAAKAETATDRIRRLAD
jgi:hypothetical protein